MRRAENSSLKDEESKEIDGFRKIKVFNKKKIAKVIAISICTTLLIACGIAFNTYIKGEQIDSSNLDIEVLSVEDKFVSLEIKSKDNVSGITDVTVKDNSGDINVVVKSASKSIFSKKEVAVKKKFKTNIKKLTVADAIIYEDGYMIDEGTRNIYMSRLKNLRSDEKVNNLIENINVKVPYLETNLIDVDDADLSKVVLEATKYGNMTASNVEHYATMFSYYMFACVDDIKTIEWRYIINDKEKRYTIQLSDANNLLEVEDIQSFGKTASGIIKLDGYVN
jgi:hypothetical protein